MPSTGSSAGGAGGGGPTVTVLITGKVVNEGDISQDIYNAFTKALGDVFKSKRFAVHMRTMIRAMGKEMNTQMSAAGKTMTTNLQQAISNGFKNMPKAASSAANSAKNSLSHMVPHTLSAAIDRLIAQFDRLEAAAKLSAAPNVQMERVLERLNRQATVATTEGARQQTAALNTAMQNQAARTNAAAKQRVAIIQAMSNQIRAIERGIGSAIKFGIDIATRAVHALGNALRGIGRAAQAGARASAAAMRGVATAIQGVVRGVGRLSAGLASGFARGFGAISRALSGALRRDEGALRSSLSRRERMVGSSASRQSSLLSRLTTPAGLTAIAGGAGIGRILTGGFERFANIERLNFQLERMLGSSTEAASMIERISNFARTTSFDLVGVAGLATNFLAIGQSADETMESISGLADIVAFTGGTTDSLERIQRAMGQIISTGRLQGDELNQLAENLPGINIRKIIADQLGVSTEELVAMQEAGELDADTFINAFLTGIQDPRFEGAAQEIAKTLSGRLANLRETFDIFGASLVGLVADPLREGMSGVTDVLNSVGAFISGEMFAVPEGAENPFAAMAADAEVLIEDLPAEFQAALDEMGFTGPFVSAGDAAQWWEDNMAPPAEVSETMQRLQELREVLGDFAKGAGGFLAAAGGAKLLFGALRFLISPLTVVTGLFGLLGAMWGRMMGASVQLRSAVRSLFGGFRLLRTALGGLLSTVGKLVSNVLFGDGDFFKNLGDTVSDFVLDINLGVRAFTDWVEWVDEMISSGEGFGVILDNILDHVENFVGNILGLSQEEIDWAKLGPGNDTVDIFTAFLDKLENVPILGSVVKFARRIVDTISDALSGLFGGFGGFVGDLWNMIFGGGVGTGEEGGLSAMEERLFGTESEQRSMGTRVLDTLEDTFLGPVVRFFRGPFADGVESAVGSVVGFFQGEGFGNMLTNVQDFFAPALEAVSGAISTAWGIIGPIVQPLIEEVQKLFDAFTNWDFSEIDVGELVRNALIGGIAGFAIGGLPGLAIGGLAGVLFDPLVESIGIAWESEIKPALDGVWNSIKAWFGSTFDSESLLTYANFILDFFHEAGRRVAGFATSEAFIGASVALVIAGVLLVGAFTLGLVEGLAEAAVEWTDKIGTAIEDAWAAIAPDFIPDPIVEAISEVLGNSVTAGFAILGGALLGKTIITSIIGGITGFGPALIRGAGGIMGMLGFGKKGQQVTGGVFDQDAKMKPFDTLGKSIAGAIVGGFLAFSFGKAAGEAGGMGGILLSILSGGATGAMLGAVIAPGQPWAVAIGAALGAGAAGLGVFFGSAERRAKEARLEVEALTEALRDLTGQELVQGLADEFRTGLLANAGAAGMEDWGNMLIENFDVPQFAENLAAGVAEADVEFAGMFAGLTDEMSTILQDVDIPQADADNFMRLLSEQMRIAAESGDFTNFDDLMAAAVGRVEEIDPELARRISGAVGGVRGLMERVFSSGKPITMGDLENAYNQINDFVNNTNSSFNALDTEEAVNALDTVGEAVDELQIILDKDINVGAQASQIAELFAGSELTADQKFEALAEAADLARDAIDEAADALADFFEEQLVPKEVEDQLREFRLDIPGIGEQIQQSLAPTEGEGGVMVEVPVDVQADIKDQAVFDFRQDVANMLAEGAREGFVDTPAEFTEWIGGMRDAIQGAIDSGELAPDVGGMFLDVIDDADKAGMSEAGVALFNAVVDAQADASAIDTASGQVVQQIADGIMAHQGLITGAFSNVISLGGGDLITGGLYAPETGGVGQLVVDEITASIEAGGPAISDALDTAVGGVGPGQFGTVFDPGGPVGSAMMESAGRLGTAVGTKVGTDAKTAITTSLAGLGGGGGTQAVGITSAPSDAGGVGSGLVDSVVGAIEDGAGAVQAAAQALGAAFARGIAGTARQAAAAARVSAVLASVNFNRGQGAAYSAGQNLARNFANGIRSMAFAVASAAAAIAQAAINAARATLQMFSPSKVFVGIGQEVGESFMSGIEETEGDMASAMSEAISNAIDRVTNTAQAAAAEAGAAIFSALIPSILPGGTPTSTIQSANAAIRQQIGGFTAGLRESAAGGLGNQATAATQQAAAALRIMSTEFTVAQREIRAEVAEAIAHRDDIEEWIEAMAELRENEASGALGLALFNEEVAELRVQLNAGLMTQEQYNDALEELNKKLKAGILNTEAYEDALSELGDRPEALTLRELNLIASGAQSTNLGTFAGQANFDAINEALGAIQDYADAAIESGVAVGSVAGTVNAYVQNLRAAAQRSGLALTEVDNWIRAMGLMPGQIAVWTASLTSLNIATAAGQTNIQMINEQLEAIRSYGIQLIEAGYAAGTVQSELARLTQSLVSQATAFGFNATSINQLVAAAGLSTTALAAFVAEMQAFTIAARDAEAAAAAAAAAAELARQEEAAAAITPVGRPVVENLNVYLPYGDPEAAGLAAANHIAYSTLTSW